MKSNAMGAGCLALFGLPFAAVGTVCTGFIFYLFFMFHQTQSWVETKAHFESLDLKTNSSSDGTTYKVEGT
ncbi:MAG: hypothetical protein HRT89_14500, partial [Lentisphaeria bacterium]|nr:hypothetical protein [Lentisphaeria bacterium]NQZ69268.1 hypothetical protein [Lentisphaeria bacterium]